VLSRRQAIAAGITPSALRWLVTSGRWRRPFPGVYLQAGGEPTAWQRARAATLRITGVTACVSGASAAEVLELEVVNPPAEVSLILPRGTRVYDRSGLRLRWLDLSGSDVTEVRGLLATTPARTVVDLLAAGDRLTAVWAAEHGLRTRRVQRAEVEAKLLTLHNHRINQARRRWRLVDERSESPLETLLRLVLLDARLPKPELQALVHDQFGHPVARVDLLFRRQWVGVEADGRGPHELPQALFRDRARQNALQQAGLRVLRFTWPEVAGHPEVVVAQVREALTVG
jgi:very-short-patch-repair endonuclease